MTEPPEPGPDGAWTRLAPTFDGPAHYAIRVEGRLSPDWSSLLNGLSLTPAVADGTPVTDLTGELRDQAALLGVLNTLYDLRLPLLSVVRAPDAARPAPPRRRATGAPAARRRGG